jgi:uncharacterized membrane protein
MHYGMYPVHTIWMALSWIVGSGLLFACIWLSFSAIYVKGRSSPVEILEQRYAAGEIDTDEYNRRLAELSKNKPAA